jgi:amino-acid N-acetyltransferase
MEEVATHTAVALQAEKLVFLCDAPGVTDERGELIQYLTADEAQPLLAEPERLTEDLGLYLPRCIHAVRNGVKRAHLIDHDIDGGLLLEFFTHAGVGTVIARDPLARVRDAGIDDVGAVLALIAPLEADGTLVRRGRELLEMEIGHFSLLDHDGVIIGCAALYPFPDEKSAELACLAVNPEYRRSGYGEGLLSHIEARARRAGLQRLFVLTTRTAQWFLERGFKDGGVDALPQQKRGFYNLQRRSKVLVKAL